MTTALLIYIYLTLQNISFFIALAGWGILVTTLVIFTCTYLDSKEHGYNQEMEKGNEAALKLSTNILKKHWGKLLFSILLVHFVPDTNDLKFIIGGTVLVEGGKAIYEVEGVRELPENLVSAANHFLTAVTEESTENNK